MHPHASGIPLPVGVLLCLLVVLVPQPSPAPRRDVGRDVDRLRQAECEYRGITATFEDLTRAYLLEAYQDGEVVRWEGQPARGNPEYESVVTAWCRAGGPRPSRERTVPAAAAARRSAAGGRFPVRWRYGTLAAVRIEPANEFASDALAVFRATVDRLVRSLVIVEEATPLRADPAADAAVLRQVEAGSVLVKEEAPAGAAAAPGWCFVRVPATPERGWIASDRLAPVDDGQ